MSYTDPSGYFFNKLFKGINKALGKFAPIVAFGLAIMGQGWAAQGIWHAATIGFVSGGVATGSLKGALIGAFSAEAFQQIGQHFNDAGWRNDFMNAAAGEDSPFFKNFTSFGGNNLTSSQVAQQIGAHAA